MAEFREEHHNVNGIDTAVFTAGDGEPLVFLHGAGTATGFDYLLPLAERNRLIVPNHPGFGASASDPSIDSIQDYVLHYLDLLDLLWLDEVSLVGHSMGGYISSTLAIESPARVLRLVLAAPFGLLDAEHPTVDLSGIPEEEIGGYLTADPSVFAVLPNPPTPEFLADRQREAASWAQVKLEGPYDRKLGKWLHRVVAPTLVLWGDADRLIPVGQAQAWANELPAASVKTFPGVGHFIFDESRAAVDAVGDFVAEVSA